MNYGVIMAGGAGTRLWPLSRGGTPKQLLSVIRGNYERSRGARDRDVHVEAARQVPRHRVRELLHDLAVAEVVGHASPARRERMRPGPRDQQRPAHVLAQAQPRLGEGDAGGDRVAGDRRPELDLALTELVAEALVRLTRSTDLVARYGGDEFIVMLEGANKEIADEVAQRIRNVVFATTLEVDVKIVRIKVNVGAASFPEHGNNLQAVMAAADRLMYKDKELREPPKGKLIIQKR